MAEREFTNAPDLTGWVIAAGAGLVALGVSVVVGEFALTPAVFFAAVITGVVGLILGMPRGQSVAAPAAQDVAEPAAAPAPAAAVAATPSAPLMSVPAVDLSTASETPSSGPEQLSAPRGGKADDLKEIEGIGPALENLLNSLGFYHFDQIASWSEADIAWVDANMKNFKGRIVRDKWVAQAKLIVSEGLEAFRVRAKTNDY